ncbi:uncharacterized protein SPSK_02890 [Sporothrix schenckii 1099-18]|uniref:Uncharacterized protein n=1 Tax=Sporothrix schenckii 1099-18 TaxID=1397361 RepID=A0A0F2MBZ3_SPOSC|nr:uncharacterized protein SPSK_02890 [Sporothrix schenckii 1099-18]KJR86584.1 hypothetical protein SPSK_02890 [Sporothrix schenckii 1099-18]
MHRDLTPVPYVQCPVTMPAVTGQCTPTIRNPQPATHRTLSPSHHTFGPADQPEARIDTCFTAAANFVVQDREM